MPRQPRQKSMQVLALGLSRTGTMCAFHHSYESNKFANHGGKGRLPTDTHPALWTALNKLGYISYHGLEASLGNANGSLDFWGDAINAKLNGATQHIPRTAKDFDKVLWRYDAVTDLPCLLFAQELLAAYPYAKVILTERDVDSWLISMRRSLYRIISHRGLRVLRIVDVEFTKKYYMVLLGALRIWTGGGDGVYDFEKLREGYLAHYARMRDIVPKERLLEWHARDGWGPLCEFLGRDVPGGEFPRVNQDTFAGDMHDKMVIFRFLVVGLGLLKMVSPLVIVRVAWWF